MDDIIWLERFIEGVDSLEKLGFSKVVTKFGSELKKQGIESGSVFVKPNDKRFRKIFLNSNTYDSPDRIGCIGFVGEAFCIKIKTLKSYFGDYKTNYNRMDDGTDVVFNDLSVGNINKVVAWTEKEELSSYDEVEIKNLVFYWGKLR